MNQLTCTRVFPILLASSVLAGTGCVQTSICETHSALCGEDRLTRIENCSTIPGATLGDEYTFDLNEIAAGVYGVYGNWRVVSALPPGLSLDPDTGIISGVPTELGAVALELSVVDLGRGSSTPYVFSCGEIVVSERLSALDIRFEENHCVPHTASREEMIAMLRGGDGSEITCLPLDDEGGSCPLGNGNGRPPPGITFDAETCTHSGDIAGERRGTWVWMVAIQQSVRNDDDVTTYVPFCASNDIDTYHDIAVTLGGSGQSDLVPGLLEYDPDVAPVFQQGDYIWEVSDPACIDNPSLCSSYGFRFDVTCSPFDLPFEGSSSKTGQGLTHDLGAMGPVTSENFRFRPWVASFNFAYCTSNSVAYCDETSSNFEANAQTAYHFDVVAYPVEPSEK